MNPNLNLKSQAQALIKDIGRRTNSDQLLLFKSVNVLQSFSVNIFQMTFSPLLSKPPRLHLIKVIW